MSLYNRTPRPIDFVGQYQRGVSFRRALEEADRRKASEEEKAALEEAAERERLMIQDARRMKYFIDNDLFQEAQDFGIDRLQRLTNEGRDTKETESVMGKVVAGDWQGASNDINAYLTGVGQIDAAPKGQDLTANIKDFLYYRQMLDSGKEEDARMFANKAGLTKLSPEEAADLKIKSESAKQKEKERITRLGNFAMNGIGAADGTVNLRRALELLKGTRTGGFSEVLMRAKEFFNVEGAKDEGELSSLMGKSVLSQLKSTFGAAFTLKEGERLEALEAGFGRSVATNRRLINNALTIANRAARRGIKAAEELGDDFQAKEIKEALEFGLSRPKEESVTGRFSPVLGRNVTEKDIQAIKERGYTEDEIIQRLGL